MFQANDLVSHKSVPGCVGIVIWHPSKDHPVTVAWMIYSNTYPESYAPEYTYHLSNRITLISSVLRDV